LTASFDEMRGSGGSGVREPYLSVQQWLSTQKIEDLKRKRDDAEALFRRTGITFAVYGDDAATDICEFAAPTADAAGCAVAFGCRAAGRTVAGEGCANPRDARGQAQDVGARAGGADLGSGSASDRDQAVEGKRVRAVVSCQTGIVSTSRPLSSFTL
jgi:hypothetical protein